MQLPKDLLSMIMDYHRDLQETEWRESMNQHIRNLNMLEELLFAHSSFVTYKLEFDGNPPYVIACLDEIRGYKWVPQYWKKEITLNHPRVQAIIARVPLFVKSQIMEYQKSSKYK